ncbi:hypothetical protein LPTSP4_16250 [Leptospira ryugenii]|uniref:Uncharacterized protein n=1 Tax=Leptospira ryugenii TaxID=1917863 RepID=A0A2P2DZN2_9LEPT|nr:hypothetical protein [Leptospira ryugenii]GBF50101.1 hypothetical protein LPTSP4_16250 [Leptospira ryugenii]
MKESLNKIFLIICSIHTFHCAAFPVHSVQKGVNPPFPNEFLKANLIFTGFHRFEREELKIRNELKKIGFSEDKISDTTIEFRLERNYPIYRYLWLHRMHAVLTVLSGGLLPYYTYADQRLKIQYWKDKELRKESRYDLSLHQWRGTLVLLVTIPYFPDQTFSDLFESSLQEELQK